MAIGTGTTNLVQGTAAGGERLQGWRYFTTILHTGGGENDTLIGGLNGDELHDDGAAATLIGGGGNDLYYVSGDYGLIVELPNGGLDTLFTSGPVLFLGLGLENLVLLEGTEAHGNELRNRIVGNDGDNLLYGDGLADAASLLQDTLEGGAGDDTYVLTGNEVIVEKPGEGTDTIILHAVALGDWHVLSQDVEIFLLEEGILESILMEGNELPNLIRGGAGQDTLIGRAGADTLLGLGGDDRYYVDDPDDVVIETADGGYDSVSTSLPAYVLPAHVENLGLSGDTGVVAVGIGNELRNWIKGNFVGNHRYEGGGGDDILEGMGVDTYVGGAGNDEIDDRYSYGTAVYEGPMAQYQVTHGPDYNTTVTGAEGTDWLRSVDRIQFADGELVLNHRTQGTLSIVGDPSKAGELRADFAGLADADGIASVQYLWEEDSDDQGQGSTLAIDPQVGRYYAWTVAVTVVDLKGYQETFYASLNWYRAAPEPPTPVPPSVLQAIELEPPNEEGQWVVLHFDQPVASLPWPDGVSLYSGGDVWWWSLFVSGERFVLEGNTIRLHAPHAFIQGERVHFSSEGLNFVGWEGGTWFDVPLPDAPDVPGPQLDPLYLPERLPYSQLSLTFLEAVHRGQGDIVLKTLAGEEVFRVDVQGPDVTVRGPQAYITWPDHPPAGARLVLEWADGVFADAQGRPGAAQSFVVPTHAVWQVATSMDGDCLFGTELIDELIGEVGDDTFVGGAEDDWLDGDQGQDTAAFRGLRAQYTLAKASEVLPPWGRSSEGETYVLSDLVDGRDGADHLRAVEVLDFQDYQVDLTMPSWASWSAPGQLKLLQELYVACFNRIPEARGLKHWLLELSGGTTMETIADRFHAAGIEFGIYEEGMTDDAFIASLYTNVLGRGPESDTAPNTDEIGFWSAVLESGTHSRGGVVLQMLQDVHAWFENDPTYGFVERLLDNKASLADYYAVEHGLGRHSEAEDIAFGRELAALVTPDGIAAAIALIGIEASGAV